MIVTVSFEYETCIKCGITFWIPATFQGKLKETKNSFYCPNGHAQFYSGETEAQRLKKLLDSKYALLEAKNTELATALRLKAQLEQALSKLQKTGSRKKCPYCGKAYKFLSTHIRNRHPQPK